MAKAKKKTKAKVAKKATAPVEVKVEKEIPQEPLPKRIRMLMSIANEKVAYEPGHVYEVGKDVSAESARSYLKSGVAEVDASAEGPSETK